MKSIMNSFEWTDCKNEHVNIIMKDIVGTSNYVDNRITKSQKVGW
jgi:hypothetical protein